MAGAAKAAVEAVQDGVKKLAVKEGSVCPRWSTVIPKIIN